MNLDLSDPRAFVTAEFDKWGEGKFQIMHCSPKTTCARISVAAGVSAAKNCVGEECDL